MDFKAIEEMIKAIDNSNVGYLEVNWQGISIVMRKQGEPDLSKQTQCVSTVEKEKPVMEESVEDKKLEEKIKNINKEVKEELNVKEITSPIVGTFYSSASPDKPPFVEVGTKVKKGDTLCVVEAMKLMNEIQSEVDGEITQILVENTEMVEYGQSMFKIRVK